MKDTMIGVAAVAAGLVLLSDTLTLRNVMAALELWPVFLVLTGLAILVDGGRRHAR